jgi:hypothetical protein
MCLFRRFALVTLSSFFLIACLKTNLNAQELVPANNQPVIIGLGYDSISATFKNNSCVYFDNPENDKPASAQRNYERITTLNDSEDLFQSTQIAASASFGFGIFKGNASLDYVQKGRFTRYGEYLLVSVHAENTIKFKSSPHLTREARRIAERNPIEFFKRCGDRFVTGLISGGDFTVVFSGESQTEQQQTDVKAAFKAAAFANSLDVKTNISLSKMASRGKIEAEVLRSGSGEPFPKNNIPAMIEYARLYPCKVGVSSAENIPLSCIDEHGKAIKGTPWIIDYEVQSYEDLLPSLKGLTDIQNTTLETLSTYVRKLYQQLGSMQYIKSHPDQFGDFDKAKLNHKIGEALAQIKEASDTAKNCISDSKKCSSNVLPEVSNMPSRADWVYLDQAVKVNTWTEIGRNVGNAKAVAEVRGRWFARCLPNQNPDLLKDGVGVGAFRLINRLTGAEVSIIRPANPTVLPPDTVIQYMVWDEPPSYNDNCVDPSDRLRARVFEPLFPDDFNIK